MPLTPPPLELLPGSAAVVGDETALPGSTSTYEHRYAATGEVTRAVPMAGEKDVDAAVRSARRALPAWRRMRADERRSVLLRVSAAIAAAGDELSSISMVDNAAPRLVADGGVRVASDLFAYNAGWADKIGGDLVTTWPAHGLDYVRLEPYGVVGVIIPWNGPLYALAMVLTPALAAGNCIVVKPPELAPYAAVRFGEVLLEAGMPPGVVNVVPGDADAGRALVGHPDVDKIHFTGGGHNARAVLRQASEALTPCALELGGKSANLVFEDADLDVAVRTAVGHIVGMSGQGCTMGSRVLVQESVYDEVVDRIVAGAAQVQVGDPFAPGTTMGPVITAAACERILGVVDRAVREGAGRLAHGGERLGGDLADGWFLAPTVFADVDPKSSLAREEIFGPVQSVIPFRDEDEAVAIANDVVYGLAAFVQTRDVRRAHRVADRLEVGNIWVNGTCGIPAAAPFGGMKESGEGRLGGAAGIAEFLRPKNVWLNLDGD